MNLARVDEGKDRFFISGPITFATVTILYQDLLRLIKIHSHTSITLDLDEVTDIDSTVIALLVVLDRTGKAVFTNPKRDITSLMSLYGVDWLTIDSPQ